MDFERCVQRIEALAGEEVEIEIWGPEDADSGTVAFLSGVLGRVEPVELPPVIADKLAGAEAAITFTIGGASLDFWPSRFVGAEDDPHDRGWLDVRTADAHVRVGPWRPAWS